ALHQYVVASTRYQADRSTPTRSSFVPVRSDRAPPGWCLLFSRPGLFQRPIAICCGTLGPCRRLLRSYRSRRASSTLTTVLWGGSFLPPAKHLSVKIWFHRPPPAHHVPGLKHVQVSWTRQSSSARTPHTLADHAFLQ